LTFQKNIKILLEKDLRDKKDFIVNIAIVKFYKAQTII